MRSFGCIRYKRRLNFVKSKTVTPTNFEWVRHHFPCIIQTIEEGQPGRKSLPGWPKVYKTITLVDGTKLIVHELIDRQTNTILLYQYDWEYKKGFFWKWHNETHLNPKHQTATEPHHMHHQGPSITSHARLPNWRHHDLIAVLETIRILIPIQSDLTPRP